MNEAEATVRHAIVNAITATSDITGLRGGPAVNRLVNEIVINLLDDPRVIRAVRQLANTKVEC